METNIVDKYMQSIFQEMKDDNGTFILNAGKDRVFPKIFSSIDVSNQELIKFLYRLAYENSVNAYIKMYASSVDLDFLKLMKFSEKITDFIFGNEEFFGVYSYVRANLAKKVDVRSAQEIIISCENMFLAGYKIKLIDGKYLLISPHLEVIAEFQKFEKDNFIRTQDYLEAVKELFNITQNNANLNDKQKIGALGFEIPAINEKIQFNTPVNHKNLLMPLNEVINEGFRVLDIKADENNIITVLRNKFNIKINMSFNGVKKRNYYWLTLDYAHDKFFELINNNYGFLFFNKIPSKFIVDEDGQLVSKLLTVKNESVFNGLNYVKKPLSYIMNWFPNISNEGSETLLKELSTFILQRFIFGAESVEEITQSIFINEDTREVISIYNTNNLIQKYAYSQTPNSLVNIVVDKNTSLKISREDLSEIIKNFSGNTMRPEFLNKFAFSKPLRIGDFNIREQLEAITIDNMPKVLFLNEIGIFKELGKNIIDGQLDMYDNEFCNHLKTSGIADEASLLIVIMNRLILFSVLCYLISENLL